MCVRGGPLIVQIFDRIMARQYPYMLIFLSRYRPASTDLFSFLTTAGPEELLRNTAVAGALAGLAISYLRLMHAKISC